MFIPISESYEFLKRDLGKLSYVNSSNELFLLFAQNLYKVNIEENSYEILEEESKILILLLLTITIMRHGWFLRTGTIKAALRRLILTQVRCV